MSGFIDPFGAPEIWTDKVAYREIACPGVVRLVFAAEEHGESIVKVKILMPVAVLLAEQTRTFAFLTGARAAALLM